MFLFIKKSLCVVFLLVSCGAAAPSSTEPQVIVDISADAAACAAVENSLCGPSLFCVYQDGDDLHFYTVLDAQKALQLIEQNNNDVSRVSQLKIINDFLQNFSSNLVLKDTIVDLDGVFASYQILPKKISSFFPRWGIAHAPSSTNRSRVTVDVIKTHLDVSSIDDASGDIFSDHCDAFKKILDERALGMHSFAFLYLTSAHDSLLKKEPQKVTETEIAKDLPVVPVDVITPETKAIIIPPVVAAVTMGKGLLWGLGGLVAAGLATVGLLNIDEIGFGNGIPGEGVPLADAAGQPEVVPPERVFFGPPLPPELPVPHGLPIDQGLGALGNRPPIVDLFPAGPLVVPNLPPLGVAEPVVPVVVSGQSPVIDLRLVSAPSEPVISSDQMVLRNSASTVSQTSRSRAAHGSTLQLFINPHFLCGVVAELIQVRQLPKDFLREPVLIVQGLNGKKLMFNGAQVIKLIARIDFSGYAGQGIELGDEGDLHALGAARSSESDFLQKLIRFLMSKFSSDDHASEELLLCASGDFSGDAMVTGTVFDSPSNPETIAGPRLQRVSASEKPVIVRIPDNGEIKLNHDFLQFIRSLSFAMEQHQRTDLPPQEGGRLSVWTNSTEDYFTDTTLSDLLRTQGGLLGSDRRYSFKEVLDGKQPADGHDPLNTARVEDGTPPTTPPKTPPRAGAGDGAGDGRLATHSAPQSRRRGSLVPSQISPKEKPYYDIFGESFFELSESRRDHFMGNPFPSFLYGREKPEQFDFSGPAIFYSYADKEGNVFYYTYEQVLSTLSKCTDTELFRLKDVSGSIFKMVRIPVSRDNFSGADTKIRKSLLGQFEKHGLVPNLLNPGEKIQDGLIDMFFSPMSKFRSFLSLAAMQDKDLVLVPRLDSKSGQDEELLNQRALSAYPFQYLVRRKGAVKQDSESSYEPFFLLDIPFDSDGEELR